MYIKVQNLVKNYIRSIEGSEEARSLKQTLARGDPISDQRIIDLLNKRLSKPDCVINGWILDGAPCTLEQIVVFKQLAITPQIVISLEISDELVYSRLEQRRFDPITGKHVMLLEEGKPLPPKHVLQRLIQDPNDAHQSIKKRLLDYRSFVPHIENEYKGRLILNGEDKPDVIFRNFCEAIENVVVEESDPSEMEQAKQSVGTSKMQNQEEEEQ